MHSIIVVVEVPAPGFSLEVTPDSLTVEPGSSGTSTITVTSVMGFAGTVSLSTTVSDPCLTASLDPTSVVLSADEAEISVLTVEVDPLTPPGFYSVIVDGSSGFLIDFAFVLVTVGPEDTTPPLWPPGSSLIASETGATHVSLSSTAAIDDVAVDGYLVYQDSVLAATVSGATTSLTVTGLASGTSYAFKVEAADATGEHQHRWPLTDGYNCRATQ